MSTPSTAGCWGFDGPSPDPNLYYESELFVAGALSTMPPFDEHHPAYALPYARRALEAMSEFEPTDDGGSKGSSGEANDG